MSAIAYEERGEVGERGWRTVLPALSRGVLLAAAGVLAGLVDVVVLLSSHDRALHSGSLIAQAVLPVWAFVAAGVIAVARRPSGRLGPLMVAVGVVSAAPLLTASPAPLLYTIGLGAQYLWAAALGHMVLAFPDGRLRGTAERLVVAAAYVTAGVVQLIGLTVSGSSHLGCTQRCPRNLLLVSTHDELAAATDVVQAIVSIGATGVVAAILIKRWHAASASRRRALAPVLWCATVTAVVIAYLAATTLGAGRWGSRAEWVLTVGLASVPFAYLVGLARSHLYRAAAITTLVERLERLPGPGQLRPALAGALGDPNLAVAYWLPERGTYVDAGGRPVDLPVAASGRAVTIVENESGPVAALVHDASLAEEPELVHAVGAPAAVWLDNLRLQAQLRARIEALRESRARVIHAGDSERRRIERDLHDGAQQRLAALLLSIKLGREDPDLDPAQLLDGVEFELASALRELRALAAGILPPVLTDRGLDAALRELAARCPLPVIINDTPAERLTPALEVAAYFVVAEALANVIKHSRATIAHVAVSRSTDSVLVAVRDDGIGGAQAAHGTGLRGLGDRVGALNGRLSVESPRGRGTIVRAQLPCAS